MITLRSVLEDMDVRNRRFQERRVPSGAARAGVEAFLPVRLASGIYRKSKIL